MNFKHITSFIPKPSQSVIILLYLLTLPLILFAQTTAIIKPGELIRDFTGKNVNAHCGHIVKFGDLYYWYGEDRIGDRAQVTCYSSKDLQKWNFERVVLTSLGTESGFIERPKVIYNEHTRQYVMWMHKEGPNGYNEARAAVATSNAPDGIFTYHGSFRPNGNMSRDDYLFKDDDGKAYFISASNDNADEKLYQLSADYLSIDHEVATLFKGQYREAPVIFKRKGIYYLITSFCTGIKPNPQYYATAKSINGPWSENKLLPSRKTWNTYYSQGACVFPVKGDTETTFVYNLDRWVQPMRHVWLPLEFGKRGEIKPLEWYDEWRLNLKTGKAILPPAMQPLANNMARGKKVISSFDSPGEMFDYGHMANHPPSFAVDGNTNTAWAANDNLSHWIQIDMLAPKNIDDISLKFWKAGAHHFRISASPDGTNWKDVTDSTTLPKTDSIRYSCKLRNERYFRFWYVGSDRGYNWTALSEFAAFENGINVAENKPVRSDNYQFPTNAKNVNDGNFSTAWVVDNWKLPQSVTINLGHTTSLRGTRIFWEASGVAHQFLLESSINQKVWKTIVDETRNRKPVSMSLNKLNIRSARFLRLTLTGVDSLGVEKIKEGMRPWPGVREIETF